MERYTTHHAKIMIDGKPAAMPQQTVNMTAQEIVDYGMSHYNFDPETKTAQNKFTAYMRAVSEAIFDPSYWKNPIYAKAPDCGNEWAKAVVIWFHGVSPVETFSGVMSNGYAC